MPPQRSAGHAGGASPTLMQGNALPVTCCTAAGNLQRRSIDACSA